MQQEIKSNRLRWIKALESGKYKQCMGELYNSEKRSYCCLGVWCRMNTKTGISIYESNFVGGKSNEDSLLPYAYINPELLSVAGRKSLSMSKLQQMKAADMNDKGQSFTEIANYFRKVWKLHE